MAGDGQVTSLEVLIARRFLWVQWLRIGPRLSDPRRRQHVFAHVIGFCATNLQTLVGPADMEEEVES